MKAEEIIEELIELSNTKYGYIKVGRDTLNLDLLFIEKYETLKKILGITSIETYDFSDLPRMKILKEQIEKISQYENKKVDSNRMMNKAVKAYKK